MSDEITVVINGGLNNGQSAQLGPKFPTFPSIFKVPNSLVVEKENRYEPLVASIGPYHHEEKFEVTEDHKMLYVQNLISRRTPPNVSATFDTLITNIEMVKVEVGACYAEKLEIPTAQVNSNTVDKFVEMMVIDGCFLLELLYKYKEHEKLRSDVATAATEADKETAAAAIATV